jgi:hypothetical protein
VTRRRIQPKPMDELETVSLRLPAQSVRVVSEVPRGSTDRTYVITQAIEIAFRRDADFEKTPPARAAEPVVSALRATAQPPCPPTCRAPSVPAGRGPLLWRLPYCACIHYRPLRHSQRTVLLPSSLGAFPMPLGPKPNQPIRRCKIKPVPHRPAAPCPLCGGQSTYTR